MLAETDGLDAPLRTITSELAVDALPAPYGHADLSVARMAVGLPNANAACGILMQGAPGMLHVSTSGRQIWQPRSDYHVCTQAIVEWYSIHAFPDQWSASFNIAADMAIVDWTIAAGLFDALVIGKEATPSMMFGITHQFERAGVSVELTSSWSSTPRCTISANLALADSIMMGFSIGASPVSVHSTIRFPAGHGLVVVLGIRQRELLGIQPRITLCWRSPSCL